MKSLRFIPLLLLPLFLAGCGTLSHEDRQVLQAHEVSRDVYDKMLDGAPLSMDDVIQLSQRAVPPGLIINYMDEVGTVYILRKTDVRKLRSSGVNEQVIAYMLSTAPQSGPYPGPYAGPYAAGAYPYGPYPYDYYGYGYGYYGPAIFIGGYGWGRGGWGHGGWGHGGWGHGGYGGHGGGHGHH